MIIIAIYIAPRLSGALNAVQSLFVMTKTHLCKSHSHTHTQTNKQTNKQTHTHKQTNKQTHTQTHAHTHTHTHTHTNASVGRL